MSKLQNSDSKTSNGKGRLHILHVDDDQGFLEVSKSILELKSNFEVDNASSVDEAFKKLEKQTYDAVISDYEMPQKNGLQFLQELRGKHNSIPFVIFTGKGREEVAMKALNLGADGYYDKHGSTETVYGELAHGIRLSVEHKMAEEALRRTEEKYRTLFEDAMDAIFVVDAETGIFVDCNRAATELIGRSKSEIFGMHQRLLYPPEEGAGEFSKTFEKHRTDKGGLVIEDKIVTKNGEIRDVTIKGAPIEINGRKMLQGIFRDVTDRKEAEKRLQMLAYRLNGLSPEGSFICESHQKCFKAYADLTFHGVPGLCIVREDPEKLVKEYGVKPEEVKLLSSKPVKGFQNLQDLQEVSIAISNFHETHAKGVILLDGLEYLVSRFGFDAVYKFIQEKRFDFLENGALLLIPLHMATVSEKERALLTSELKILDTGGGGKLTSRS